MKIQINGTNTINKGAELMLYAILQEIERRCPEAIVRYTGNCYPKGYIKSSLRIETSWWSSRFFDFVHFYGIIRRFFNIDVSPKYSTSQDVDIMFDASGLCYSDSCHLSRATSKALLRSLFYFHNNRTLTVFLPQSFGPFESKNLRFMRKALGSYADILIARDEKSYSYLLEIVQKDNNHPQIWKFPDFTIKVEGEIPQKYENLRNYVLIIPNFHMTSGPKQKKTYIDLLCEISKVCINAGKEVFILNHESKRDEKLCKEMACLLGIESITALNALEAKGFISRAYLVISSRFHGAVSALNSFVPCLSTSWNFKYEELFNDYGMSEYVLNIKDKTYFINKVNLLLEDSNNSLIREKLKIYYEKNLALTENMWDAVWDYVDKHLHERC